jgi:hypothetical protein
MWKLFFKGKIEIIKMSSQKFISFLYIVIDYINKNISTKLVDYVE